MPLSCGSMQTSYRELVFTCICLFVHVFVRKGTFGKPHKQWKFQYKFQKWSQAIIKFSENQFSETVEFFSRRNYDQTLSLVTRLLHTAM